MGESSNPPQKSSGLPGGKRHFKTPKERLRIIRRILKQTDEYLDHLAYGADQTDVLRQALVDIAIAAGPPSEEMGRKKQFVD